MDFKNQEFYCYLTQRRICIWSSVLSIHIFSLNMFLNILIENDILNIFTEELQFLLYSQTLFCICINNNCNIKQKQFEANKPQCSI